MKYYLIVSLLIGLSVSQNIDVTLAEDLFQYARMAYCKKEFIQNWDAEAATRHPRMQEVQVYYNTTDEAQGYCGYDSQFDRVVIAIRGSDNIKNWYQNLNFLKKDYNHGGCKDCKIHRGFHNVYENLANNLLGCAYTLSTNHPTAKIVVTGHSLGAAQATFAAIEITHSIKKVDYFYIYGAPRVGNENYANFIEQKLSHTTVVRVTHWKDAVLHLPTTWMGFSNPGWELYLKSDDWSKDIEICFHDSDKCANRFYWPWQWNIKDHLFYFGQCSGCNRSGCDKYLAELGQA